jgi:hypothetical protein
MAGSNARQIIIRGRIVLAGAMNRVAPCLAMSHNVTIR